MKVLKSMGVLFIALGFTVGATWSSGVGAGTAMGALWGVVAGMWLLLIWWRSEP